MTITLPRTLRPEEREKAEQLYPKEEFFTQRGIGEQLVAAPLLEQLYEDASESNPPGWAVIQGAVDWRRVGVNADIPEDLLRTLFASYLAVAQPEVDATDEKFRAGIAWARKPVAGSVAPINSIQGEDQSRYRPFDYIVAYVDGQRPEEAVPIPRSTWDFVITQSTAGDLLDIGFEAITRKERLIARSAFDRALNSDDADVTPWAALVLRGSGGGRREFYTR